jgi:hypothetical protein
MAIFEDQSDIARQVLDKFTDVNEKAYSSLDDNKPRIAEYLNRILSKES